MQPYLQLNDIILQILIMFLHMYNRLKVIVFYLKISAFYKDESL